MDNEKVLVVKTTLLNLPQTDYMDDPIQIQMLLNVCRDNYLFMDRVAAETNPLYKQLIPYVTVICSGEVLYLERKAAQSEARLHGKISLGVGGHINPVDESNSFTGIIAQAMTRELKEELWLFADAQPVLRGLVNDDSNSVGAVHLGLHFLLFVEERPHVRETEKMRASWLSPLQLEALRPRMETWSQILLPALVRADHL